MRVRQAIHLAGPVLKWMETDFRLRSKPEPGLDVRGIAFAKHCESETVL
jgi:hypothetical protein